MLTYGLGEQQVARRAAGGLTTPGATRQTCWRHRAAGAKSPTRARCPQRRKPVFAFLNIDRNFHLEQSWKRQEQRDAMLADIKPAQLASGVVPVLDAQHLEALLNAAGGSLVVVFFYSRSCGLCKAVEADLLELLQESRRMRARLVVLKHDVRDEYDFPSDIAREYRIKAVPRILVFVDGAVVATVDGANLDSRQLAGRQQVASSLAAQSSHLRRTITAMLLRHTPSARA